MIDGIFAPILQGGNLISRNTLTKRAGTGGLVMLLAQKHLNVRLCGVVSHEAVRLLLPNGLRICMHEGVNHLSTRDDKNKDHTNGNKHNHDPNNGHAMTS